MTESKRTQIDLFFRSMKRVRRDSMYSFSKLSSLDRKENDSGLPYWNEESH